MVRHRPPFGDVSARAVHVRLIGGEPRVQARGGAALGRIRGRVGDEVIVLTLDEEDRVRSARCPAEAGERHTAESVVAEIVHALALGQQGGIEPLALGYGIRNWRRLVLRTHVCGYLTKEARHFDDGWLLVNENSPATEYMHIRRERGGPDHAQKVGKGQRQEGVRMVLSCRIVNNTVLV